MSDWVRPVNLANSGGLWDKGWVQGGPFPDDVAADISSGFGPRTPIAQPDGGETSAFHTGLDLAAPSGTPLLALGSGTVFIAEYRGDLGYWLRVITDEGDAYDYFHMLGPSLALAGQRVEQGQQIGEVGATGYANGPHLHLATLFRSDYRDPYAVLLAAPRLPAIPEPGQPEPEPTVTSMRGLTPQQFVFAYYRLFDPATLDLDRFRAPDFEWGETAQDDEWEVYPLRMRRR